MIDNYTIRMIFLGLGSNMGDRLLHLERACSFISERAGEIVKKSACYETAAWGDTNQSNFYNLVIALESKLPPLVLINSLLEIESDMGRIRKQKWGARIIDIDILLYNNEIIDLPELKIPHPFLAERRFVLEPLAEIAPNVVEPVHKKSIATLLQQCPDSSMVKKINSL
jgi:2-amino-4-hydroxy-6-hydroxymethyldihydropteridine diphosphokinase